MKTSTLTALCGLILASGSTAFATIIDFETQPAGPSTFAGAGNEQTLVYTFGSLVVTFSGGVILTDETSQTTDDTNVYATCAPSLCGQSGTGFANPLVVTFSAPVQNFQIDILNALSGNYTMSDNNGNSVMFNLATTGGSLATEGFAATGTQVTIAYADSATSWDFAIDNVLFNQPLGSTGSGTPEPASWMTFGAGLLVILGLRARNFLVKPAR